MGEQHPLAIELRDHRIGKQAATAARRKARSQEEIAITVHHEARHAAAGERGKARAHALRCAAAVVVADPELEQVAENVEGLCARRLVCQELEELIDRGRRVRSQVQVRDEQARHRRSRRSYLGERIFGSGGAAAAGALADTIVALSMMTGLSGASCLKGPILPVGTSPIRSITSIPCTTRP